MCKCVKCFNFKTKLLTLENIELPENLTFKKYKPILKHLFDFGQTTIWFCKRGKLPVSAYVTKFIAESVENKDCGCMDV